MNDSNRVLDVVVIGGGQAGLATGWQLQQQGLEYLILDEQKSPGGNWRNYYESLQLFSPAEYSALPGRAFPGDPKGYPLRDEVVQYLRHTPPSFSCLFRAIPAWWRSCRRTRHLRFAPPTERLSLRVLW